ncbi:MULTISPECIES: acetyl-CoA decarbonylase/synthase complex subunit gamma [Methanobacterium]|jgi:acetyl-CoA decarbonylase/synthase complex subunit gamma|uniref:Acetyl-CoA decarbonylase/synthase complex subunit gamma n=1 Tax=Methanobacterium subterraneum TaxID=59277 RepID=A0A2H4VQS7_9EURY|nr:MULTISPECIES: acetyl-CoA decarbonylase/synthase complex subunit gamma [Methanobacterium]MBW4258179.1 acetyl-CoA decarbonylase/synthase complex subunit gamma [Methanobacterium sp. YSL]AUB55724.1 acetyl-CoA synthase subunit gamma [Methanobacterium subterraneum]AUB60412.1 acetyl-CoA synthase subunit gamma [Methanobacterium subterraneum]MCC7559922.1 acetyl-CoA decarbonylase/synthase complex subunit gamma [Methanobacterium sp.]NMO10180.1 acetyl-CoA decarbonylase/synthase complex subunit gamma [M
MQVTAMDIYRLLPQTNCEDCEEAACGEASCMAFATKLSEKEAQLELCTELSPEGLNKLESLLAPAVREITIGTGDKTITIGGDEVLYRYELTYYNPTSLVIDIADNLDDDEFTERVKTIEETEFERIGEMLTLDAVALRNASGNSDKFAEAASKLKKAKLPLVLCSFDPEAMKAALEKVGDERPLIYGVTEGNLEEMSALALEYSCPVTIFSPNDLEKMKQISRTLRERGIEDIVLDPGTYVEDGIGDSLDNFVMIRRLAVEEQDEDFRFPILGIPALTWLYEKDEIQGGIREATIAATLMNKYADMLIFHGTNIWELIPVLTLRQGIYTDPRKPQAVDAGLYEFGEVDKDSPVLMTTNFALTFYTVEGDIKGKTNAYLLVLDTEGRAVDVSLAGGQLNAEAVADLIKETGIEEKVDTRKLIIPGLAAPVSGEIEDESGWEVLVGPRDSSAVPGFIDELKEKA